MSKEATVYLNITVLGDEQQPLNVIPSFVANSTSPATHSLTALASGANTITPPSTAKYALLVPISTATVTKTLKGVTGDTGIPISITQPTLISLASSPGTFVITSGGIENIDIYFF